MRYRSPAVRWARGAMFLPFYVFGIWDESQQVSVQLQTSLLPEVTSASLQVCPKSLQVYSASIHAEADLTGLRGFIAGHPYSAAFLNISLIVICEVLVVLRIVKKASRGKPGYIVGDIVQPTRVIVRKPVVKQVESLQPLMESQTLPTVPKDFSHMLVLEEEGRSWLSSFCGNTKKKIA